MRIATWNVNSVRQRIEHLQRYLREIEPDVLCLQELKCLDEAFPRMEIEALGYNVATHGQKTFNGVAILSKSPLEDVRTGLPGDETDSQARYIEAVISHGDRVVRVASIYLPNGNPVGTEKYPYKLGWMDRLHAHAAVAHVVQHLDPRGELVAQAPHQGVVVNYQDVVGHDAPDSTTDQPNSVVHSLGSRKGAKAAKKGSTSWRSGRLCVRIKHY